jgi:hypothetical protein
MCLSWRLKSTPQLASNASYLSLSLSLSLSPSLHGIPVVDRAVLHTMVGYGFCWLCISCHCTHQSNLSPALIFCRFNLAHVTIETRAQGSSVKSIRFPS